MPYLVLHSGGGRGGGEGATGMEPKKGKEREQDNLHKHAQNATISPLPRPTKKKKIKGKSSLVASNCRQLSLQAGTTENRITLLAGVQTTRELRHLW